MTAQSAHELDLPEINDHGVGAAPLSEIRASWEHHWLGKTPHGFLVTRFEDVTNLLRDTRFSTAALSVAEMEAEGEDAEWLKALPRTIVETEGEDHKRLRRLLLPPFTRKSTDRLRPLMREILADLMDPLVEKGHCEFVADVCDPYSMHVICGLLGAPREDSELLTGWIHDLVLRGNHNLAEDMPVIKRA
jgi:cytochrome P450